MSPQKQPFELRKHDAPSRFDVRPAADSDAKALIALIGGVYTEYPNCIQDVQTEDVRLRTALVGTAT